MSNRVKPTGKVPGPKQPAPFSTLEEIHKTCVAMHRVDFVLDDKPFALEVRRLSPAEDAKLDDIMASVMPPIIKGQTQEQDRVNFTDPEFTKKKNAVNLQARALALYWCVPEFRKAKPDLTDPQAITDFVQSQLSPAVLGILFEAVKKSGVSLAEMTNFT